MAKDLSGRVIWHIHSNRWNSAITEYMISTVRSLKLLGATNYVTPLKGSPAHQRLQSTGVAVHCVSHFSFFKWREFVELGLQIKPDTVITYGGTETAISLVLSSRIIAKFFRFRGQPVQSPTVMSRILEDFSHRHITRIITPSMAVLKTESQDCQVKSEIIPLGVDTERFYWSEGFARSSRPEIVIFGRLDPIKGHHRFIRIFKIMVDRWAKDSPRPILKIVGLEANTKISELRGHAEGVSLGPDDVQFVVERISDVASLMAGATIGAIPSLGSELICRVAHEFLLCGTPIFVSGAGALDEVSDGEDRLSYSGLSDEDAAKKLLTFLEASFRESAARRQQRAKRAYSHYSFSAMGQAWCGIL